MSDDGVMRITCFVAGVIVGILLAAVRYQKAYAMGQARGQTLSAIDSHSAPNPQSEEARSRGTTSKT